MSRGKQFVVIIAALALLIALPKMVGDEDKVYIAIGFLVWAVVVTLGFGYALQLASDWLDGAGASVEQAALCPAEQQHIGDDLIARGIVKFRACGKRRWRNWNARDWRSGDADSQRSAGKRHVMRHNL